MPSQFDELWSFDKVLHFTAYFVLGICALWMFIGLYPGWSERKTALFALLIASFYGLSDEIHQSFVPGRDASLGDWTADIIGVVASILFLRILKKIFVNLSFVSKSKNINV